MTLAEDPAIEEIEIALLLEAVQRRYGHELREWNPTLVRNRLRSVVAEGGLDSVSALQERVLRDSAWLDRLISGLWSRPGRGMYADAAFWRALRWKVVPFLRTWRTVNVWVAGCATGEDAWSVAVLLEEEGLGARSVIHATDIDEGSLAVARAHTVSAAQLAQWEGRYRMAGGLGSLAAWFDPSEGGATLRRSVADRIAYSRHVPGIEPSFNEFHLILFRNPFVWTEQNAVQRVASLLQDSQVRFGFLCLDSIDTMRFLPRGTWDLLDPEVVIARRVE